MADLIVPDPQLEYESLQAGLAVLEKPINVCVPAVFFPDGTLLALENLAAGGFLTYRRSASNVEPEVWDETAKEWRPESFAVLEALTPTPVMYKDGDPFPWQGILLGSGQKDKDGNPKMQPALGNYPEYFVRASFAGTLREQTVAGALRVQTFSGIGPPSAAVRLISLQDAMLAGLGLGPDEQPMNASLIRFYLKGDSLQVIGMVEIRNSGSGAEIEISNGAASILVQPDGRIEITPSNQGVVIKGDIEVDGNTTVKRISYEPISGAGRRWL